MTPVALIEAASAPPPVKQAALLGVKEFAVRFQGQSYQLIRGQAVAMSRNNITHAEVLITLAALLREFILKHNLGKVVGGDVGVVTKADKPATVRGADLVVVSRERLKAQDKASPFFTIAPELIIEVTSPSNSFDDLMAKAEEFFAIGVEAFWIVDPARQQVLLCSSPSEIKVLRASKKESIKGTGILKGLTLPLKNIFA